MRLGYLFSSQSTNPQDWVIAYAFRRMLVANQLSLR
jgi:hypothetical protein